jgi:hypothetical protein
MRARWFLILMVSWAASADGTGYAGVFPQRSESLSSKSLEDTQTDHSGDRAKSPRGEQDTRTGGHANQRQSAPPSRSAPQFRSSPGYRKPPAVHRQHAGKSEASDNFRVDPPGTARDSGKSRSASAGVPGEVGDHDPRVVRPPLPAALSGQQFKNVRSPGVSLLIRGEPPHSTGGTAAINGTQLKPKP